MQKELPRIGITIGDAAGIGPEIVLRSLEDRSIAETCVPVVIGDAALLKRVATLYGIEIPEYAVIEDLANLPEEIRYGVESAACGRAAGECIVRAVEMWKNGSIDAIATAPISKRSLSLGGFDYPGHTEFLASLTDTKAFAMSFFGRSLRVVLISTHVSLRKAIDLVKTESLVKLIRFADTQFTRLLGRRVKLAVAGLNPHASENGMFGTEEADEIVPAVTQCRDEFGIDVSGPYSPDTVFVRAFRGEFDAVVSCYHDQATIAVKSLAFGSAVNVTLGLPLIRTSVDHGTAFDIAGKGVAECSSMKAAINLAAELATIENVHQRALA